MKSNDISRRDFMRRSAGAAGATLAANAVMLDAPYLAASPAAVPPSDRVRFGMVGVGMQGSGLMRTSIGLPGVEVVAACDLYDGRQELAKEIAGKPIPVTKRYHELLENKEIDCIVAAIPDHWHKQIVVDACNAGKDIYCEKPMTHKVPEGFEMIAAEKRNNRIVQIGSQRRSSLVYAKAKELYDQGAIGEVCLVEATLGRNDPCGAWQYTVPPDLSPQTMDWETWQGTAPKHPFDPLRWTRWRCYQDYGEGIPGDLFVHLLTGIHYITGITAPPDRAVSTGGLYRWKAGRDVPDALSTFYEYPSFKAMIRVTLNTELPEITRLMGTKGILEIHNGVLTYSPQDGMDHEPCTPGWPRAMRAKYAKTWHQQHDPLPGSGNVVGGGTFYEPPGFDEDAAHLWNFFQSVRTRRPSVEDATFGNNTAIACHMANYSYFNKSYSVWDAEAKQIHS